MRRNRPGSTRRRHPVCTNHNSLYGASYQRVQREPISGTLSKASDTRLEIASFSGAGVGLSLASSPRDGFGSVIWTSRAGEQLRLFQDELYSLLFEVGRVAVDHKEATHLGP